MKIEFASMSFIGEKANGNCLAGASVYHVYEDEHRADGTLVKSAIDRAYEEIKPCLPYSEYALVIFDGKIGYKYRKGSTPIKNRKQWDAVLALVNSGKAIAPTDTDKLYFTYCKNHRITNLDNLENLDAFGKGIANEPDADSDSDDEE